MITVIVSFKLPEGVKREEIIQKFELTAHKWGENQDLIRKNYLIDLDRVIAARINNFDIIIFKT